MRIPPLQINYRFEADTGVSHAYVVQLDPVTLELQPTTPAALPGWVRLNHHQCPDCPLHSSEVPDCPMALALVELQHFAGQLDSFAPLTVSVTTPEREVRASVSAQRGVSSLMGLIIATCACPDVAWLRPMARFHLPLATEEETIYRAASMYLLAQYFRLRSGAAADVTLEGLRQRYQRLHQINLGMAARLKSEPSKDASVNAVVLLDLFAKALPYSVDDSLAELDYLFKSYLQEPEVRR